MAKLKEMGERRLLGKGIRQTVAVHEGWFGECLPDCKGESCPSAHKRLMTCLPMMTQLCDPANTSFDT